MAHIVHAACALAPRSTASPLLQVLSFFWDLASLEQVGRRALRGRVEGYAGSRVRASAQG